MIDNNEVTIIRDEPITESEMSIPASPVPASELREIYFNKANFFVKRLQRSVCKRYDPIPSAVAFQNEISKQNDIMKQIPFLQRCRFAIEQAVESGRGRPEERRR